MRQRSTVVPLVAVVLSGVVGLSGCGEQNHPAASHTDATITNPSPSLASPAAAPLPQPTALTDSLYRLADVNVPGADKVGLVEYATADDAATLDRFGRALRDVGFTPLTFEARDLAWAQSQPGNVVATVVVTPANPRAGNFTFPMEFKPLDRTWQLTRKTADLLLELGATPASPTPTG